MKTKQGGIIPDTRKVADSRKDATLKGSNIRQKQPGMFAVGKYIWRLGLSVAQALSKTFY